MANGAISSFVMSSAVETFLTILLKQVEILRLDDKLVGGRQLRMRNFAIGYHADTNSRIAMALTRWTFWRLAQVLK